MERRPRERFARRAPSLHPPSLRSNPVPHSFSQIITFDTYGVSGHANHRALSAALSSPTSSLATATLSRSGVIPPPPPPVYTLHSTPLVPKYCSLFSLPFALASHFLSPTPSSLFVNGPSGYAQARESFGAHASQARWFRTLFVSFSRYLWFCELVKVEV